MGSEETRKYVREDPLLKRLPWKTSTSFVLVYSLANCNPVEAPTQIPMFWQTTL